MKPSYRRLLRRSIIVAVVALPAFVLAAAIVSAPAPVHAGFEGDELRRARWQVDASSECDLGLSGAQAAAGMQSLRISARAGLRCELVPKTHPPYLDKLFREPLGKERWYRFSLFVADLGELHLVDNFGDNTIIAQWHASPDPFLGSGEKQRGPPLALRIYNGDWWITYGWDAAFRSEGPFLAGNRHRVGRVQTGKWMDWAFRVRWSYEADGLTQIWQDDRLIFERSGPNAYNDLRGVYLKIGLYHPTSDMTIFLDDVSLSSGTEAEGESFH